MEEYAIMNYEEAKEIIENILDSTEGKKKKRALRFALDSMYSSEEYAQLQVDVINEELCKDADCDYCPFQEKSGCKLKRVIAGE